MRKLFVVFAMLAAFAVSMNAQVSNPGVKVEGLGGYYLNTATGDHVGQVELGVGYQVNKYFYVGVQSGFWGPVESDIDNPIWDIPAFGTVRLTVPTSGRITPLVDLLFGTTVKAMDPNGHYPLGLPKYNMFQVMPGLAFDLTKSIALKGNIGYLSMNPSTTVGNKQNNLLMKLGLVVSL